MSMKSESNARWVKDLEDSIKEIFPRLKLAKFLTGKADLELTVPSGGPEVYRRVKLLVDAFVDEGFLVKTGLDANGIKAWTVQQVGGPNRVAITRHPSGSQYSIVPLGKTPFPMTNARMVSETTAVASSKINLHDFVSQSNEDDQENWVDEVEDDPDFKTAEQEEIEKYAGTAYVAGANSVVVEVGGKLRASSLVSFWVGHDVYGFSAVQNPVKPNIYQIVENDKPKEFTPEVIRAVLGAYAKKGGFGAEKRFAYDVENDGGGVSLSKDKIYSQGRADVILKLVGKPVPDRNVAVRGGEKMMTEWYTYANGDFQISFARNPGDPRAIYVKDPSPALADQPLMQRWLARNFMLTFDSKMPDRHLKTLRMQTRGLGMVETDTSVPILLKPGQDSRPSGRPKVITKIPYTLVKIDKNGGDPIYHYVSNPYNQDFTVQADPKDKKYGLKFVNKKDKSAVMHYIRAGFAPAHKSLVESKQAKTGKVMTVSVAH